MILNGAGDKALAALATFNSRMHSVAPFLKNP